MAFLTKSAFGKLAGVSRQRISVMCQKKHLVVRPDGKIDTENQTNKDYLRKQDRPDGLKSGDQKSTTKQKKTKTGKKESTSDDNRTIPTPEQAETILDGLPEDLRGMSKHDLDRMKVAINVLKERFVHDEKRGMFVARALVHKAFGDLYQIDRQEFLESPSYIAPRICQNVFKTSEPEVLTQVSEILSNEFHKVQANIKNALDRNLEAMKVESIEAHS